MTPAELQQCLRGVLGFPATPFHPDLSLDLTGLERNVDVMASHPFCALVAAGGMGEIYSLAPEEIVEVTRITVKAAQGRMPVMASIGLNTPIAVDLARRFERLGASALLVLPPYYINAPESGLLDYYQAIANASALPLVAYTRDWCAFTPAMAARLCERIPALAALKDGQGDMRRLERLMAEVGGRLAWIGGIGDDVVPAYFALGVQSYTSSISNFAPKLALALGEAGLARDFETATQLVRTYVHPFYSIRDRSRGYEVAATKKAMEIAGLAAGPVRPPLPNLRPQDAEDIRRVLESYGPYL